MLQPAEKQTQLEFASIEQLVPAGHLLRKIDKAIDFGLGTAKFFVENVRYAPGSGKLGRGHQVELTLRAG